MLVLNNISFEFGSRYLYQETSWHIKPYEKIGLIGANGTGKSTLLRIINGDYKVSEGEITKRRDLTIGFLNQDLLSYESGHTILHVAMEAFKKQNELADEIERLLHLLETDHSEDVLHKLHDAQTEFETLDGYLIKSKAEAVLEGLGFSTSRFTTSIKPVFRRMEDASYAGKNIAWLNRIFCYLMSLPTTSIYHLLSGSKSIWIIMRVQW